MRDALAEQLGQEADIQLDTLAFDGLVGPKEFGLHHDLILLGEPAGGNLLALCLGLRTADVSASLIVLAGSGANAEETESKRARYLAAGADEIIVKPFRLVHLLARIRARLVPVDPGSVAVRLGRFVFRAETRRLTDPVAGQEIRLTEKEAQILNFLLQQGDRVADRTTLLAAVWGYHPEIDTHTLETHIYRLRRKLEGDPLSPVLLITEGGGYRLLTSE